ncbi:MAG: DUF5020 family protein [Bacteroidota bacterium]|nr:DUF5020 family protein [Bacteroidota bacterium]
MRGYFLFLFSILSLQFVFSQNLQLHYDFIKDARDRNAAGRGYFTSTVEMFKVDQWGSTYFFIDMDYNGPHGGVSLGYWEIDRDMKLGNFPLMAHIELNAGMNRFVSFDNAWLFGVSYPFKVKEAFLSVYAAYKAISRQSANFQVTGTWNSTLFDGKFTMSGFIDQWCEDKTGGGKKWILLTEPQFWYNLSQNFAMGSEIEISNNFILNSNKVEIFPTIAGKWTF